MEEEVVELEARLFITYDIHPHDVAVRTVFHSPKILPIQLEARVFWDKAQVFCKISNGLTACFRDWNTGIIRKRENSVGFGDGNIAAGRAGCANAALWVELRQR